jgi:O-methyltransferase
MRANFIHIEALLRSVLDTKIPGDIAELGVWHGTTFMPMAELARQDGRRIHAVDSFEGMAQETDRDGDRFRKGALSVGGSDVFRCLAKPYGETITQFAFVHLDIDQYASTLDALRFLWPRISPGGVLVCHDWWPEENTLAAGAISDWMAEENIMMAGESRYSQHGWFIK